MKQKNKEVLPNIIIVSPKRTSIVHYWQIIPSPVSQRAFGCTSRRHQLASFSRPAAVVVSPSPPLILRTYTHILYNNFLAGLRLSRVCFFWFCSPFFFLFFFLICRLLFPATAILVSQPWYPYRREAWRVSPRGENQWPSRLPTAAVLDLKSKAIPPCPW